MRSGNRLDDEPAASSFREISFWKKKNNCFSGFLVFFFFQSKTANEHTSNCMEEEKTRFPGDFGFFSSFRKALPKELQK